MPMQGSNKRQRSKIISIRLLPGEADALEIKADQAGHTVGAYSRIVLLDAAGPRAKRRPPIQQVSYVSLLGQLGRLGSNVNQLARHANSTGTMPAIETLRETQEAIMEMRNHLLTQLRR